MAIPVSHTVVGDRVLITAEFPAENVTSMIDGAASVTLDDSDWHDVAKRVIRECTAAEHELDPGVIVLRVEHSLRDAVARALSTVEVDPEIARRRAVASVFHRLADMLMSGTVRGCNVEWTPYSPGEPASVDVWFRTRRSEGTVCIPIAFERARVAT